VAAFFWERAMRHTVQSVLGAGALCALAIGALAPPSLAAKLAAADRAWINTCIDQRKASKEEPAKLRKYCTCMQDIVEDNQPFENITALERTYPPAHEMCWEKARRK
jgi:hypothetical protein